MLRHIRAILALLSVLSLGAVQSADALSTARKAAIFAPHSSASGPSFQGPGNVVGNGVAYYGSRSYSLGYAEAAGNAYNICDVATGLVCTNVPYQPNGFVNSAAVAALPQCASSCNVATAYDSTGGNLCGSATCNLTQATNSQRPTVVFNALNGQMCMEFNSSSSQVLTSANSLTLAQPFTFAAVSERNGNFSSIGRVISSFSVSSSASLGYRNVTNTVGIGASGTVLTATASDSIFHALQGIINNSSSTASAIVVDGSTTNSSSSIGANAFAPNPIAIGSEGTNYLTGIVCEAGLFNVSFSGSQISTLNANMHSATTGWNF
jgi:hypothetical protein